MKSGGIRTYLKSLCARNIKKALGFDVNSLCHDSAAAPEDFLKGVQEEMDVRHRNGFSDERRTIRMTSLEEVLPGSDFIPLHVPLVREGASLTYHLINE